MEAPGLQVAHRTRQVHIMHQIPERLKNIKLLTDLVCRPLAHLLCTSEGALPRHLVTCVFHQSF